MAEMSDDSNALLLLLRRSTKELLEERGVFLHSIARIDEEIIKRGDKASILLRGQNNGEINDKEKKESAGI